MSLKTKLSIDPAPDVESRPSRVNEIFQKLKQQRLRKSDEDMVNKAVLPDSALELQYKRALSEPMHERTVQLNTWDAVIAQVLASLRALDSGDARPILPTSQMLVIT
eukprot:s1185_g7.t1